MIKIKNKLNIEDIPDSWLEKANKYLSEFKKTKDSDPNATLDFKNKSIWKELKTLLVETHNGKCAYCERSIEKKFESDVDHYRPKSKIDDDNSHPGYWWLAYDLDNYLIACNNCNRGNKKTSFPLMNSNKHCRDYNSYFTDMDSYKGKLDSKEKPSLINPLRENPEEFFTYNWTDSISVLIMNKEGISLDDHIRVNKTIETIDLNRKKLKKQRAIDVDIGNLVSLASRIKGLEYKLLLYEDKPKKSKKIKKSIKKLLVEVKEKTSSINTYAGLRRSIFIKNGIEEDKISND